MTPMASPIPIRERDDGTVMIGEKSVAEWVRDLRFEPVPDRYLLTREQYEEWFGSNPLRVGACGCAMGLVAVIARGADQARREMTRKDNPHDYPSLIGGWAGLDAEALRQLEDGWMWESGDGPEPTEGYAGLGRKAFLQARAAWREIEAEGRTP